jgi:hypothetical protein
MKKIVISENTKKVVKIVLIAVAILGIFIGGFFGGFSVKDKISEKEFSTYEMEAVVTEVIVDRSEVFFETTSGHIFYVVTDEIFAPFESYTITFATNGTPTVEDDEIIAISRDLKME